MIAHDIPVRFNIFGLLGYDRIFSNNLEHDTYGAR